MEDNTPDKFYRGISSADAISAEGYITEAAFSFDKFDRNPRSDDYCELSINWNDDEGALLTLLSQRKPFKTTVGSGTNEWSTRGHVNTWGQAFESWDKKEERSNKSLLKDLKNLRELCFLMLYSRSFI